MWEMHWIQSKHRIYIPGQLHISTSGLDCDLEVAHPPPPLHEQQYLFMTCMIELCNQRYLINKSKKYGLLLC